MPADPYTDAELDAAVARVDDLTDMTTDHYLTVEEEVRAALTAAAPLIAARVRADERARWSERLRQIADQAEATWGRTDHNREIIANYRAMADVLAHATTEEDHHG